MRRITSILNLRSREPRSARRYFITYCLGCCLGMAGLWFLQAPAGFPLGGPSDFTSFYTAAHMIRAGEGANLYDLETQARFQDAWLRPHGWVFKDGLMVYIYPPFFALPFLALTFLPLGWAFHAWNLVSAFLLFAAIRTLIGEGGSSRFGHPALILLIVVSFFPVFEVFNKGQATFLLLYLLAIFYRQLRRGRDLPAGIALGLGLVKPHLTLLLLLWGITRKRWRMVAAFSATALALAATSLAIVGLGGIRQYLLLSRSAMLWDGPHSFLPALMPNLRGTLVRAGRLFAWVGLDILSARNILILYFIATAALVVILFYYLRGRGRKENGFDIDFTLVLLASLIVTPYVYNHDLALILMVGFIVFGVYQARGTTDSGRRFVAAGHIALMAALAFLPKLLSAQSVFFLLCGALLLMFRIKPTVHAMSNDLQLMSLNAGSTDRSLKIVHALAYYGNYSGGIQHYVKDLARQQAMDGHDIVIVTSSGYASDPMLDGARVIRAKTLFSAFRVPFTPTLPFILLRERFDVLHVHLPLPWLDLCAILIKMLKRNIVLVITIHNDLQVTSLLSKVLAFIHNHFSIRCAIKWSDGIITSTNAFADSLPYSIPANKHCAISPGINRDMFKPLNLVRKKEVLFVGRMIPEKGLHLLVEAFKRVRSRYPEYKLIVAYQDVYSYQNYYQKAIGQSSIYIMEEKDRSREQLVTLYNTSKCLVVPSLQESYSLTILEAIACGCPVVAFKLPGPYEAFSKANVRWVPLGDVDALASQIIDCIETECNVVQNLDFNRNSWSDISRRVESVYRVALGSDLD